MKIFLSLLLAVSFVIAPTRSLACDFAKDITKNPDGSYTYTSGCHVEVGRIVKQNDIRGQQIEKLEKVIELKDLAIQTQHDRLQLWMDTSYKLEDRVNTIDRWKSTNQWLYFGLGVLTTGLAVWGAGQLK